MRPKLRIRLFSRSELENMSCSPERLRNRVVFRPTYSTEPSKSPTTRKSPTTKGLSNTIDRDANKSPRIVCMARATAIPPTPNPATRVVILKPRLSRTSNNTIDHIVILPIKFSKFRVVILAGSFSNCFCRYCSIITFKAIAAHNPIWITRLTMTMELMILRLDVGISMKSKPINRAKIKRNNHFVRLTTASSIGQSGTSFPFSSLINCLMRIKRKMPANNNTTTATTAAINQD